MLCPQQSARHDCRQLPWETRRRLQRRLQEDTAPPPSDEEGWVGGTGWTGGRGVVGRGGGGLGGWRLGSLPLLLSQLEAATIQGQSGDCRGRPSLSGPKCHLLAACFWAATPLILTLQEYLIMMSGAHFLATRIAPAFTAGIQQASGERM